MATSEGTIGRSHFRTGRFLLLLLAASVAVGAYFTFGFSPRPFSVRSVSEAVGAGMPLFVPTALILIPWRMIQRHRGIYTDLPVATAGIVFVVFAFYAIKWTVASYSL